MHGLILVTWEKYLSRRFGNEFLHKYRDTIGETVGLAPLADRVYEDEALLKGVGAVCKLTSLSVDMLLREYGSYFLTNELTSHRCAYLLNSVQSGRDLLLAMRDAHAQMRRAPEDLTPPLFKYEAVTSASNEFILIYDNYRNLCPLLWGAIKGAASLYDENVQIAEQTCMRHGASACRFKVAFSPKNEGKQQPDAQMAAQNSSKRRFADLVLSVVPMSHGITLIELQNAMRSRYQDTFSRQLRPSILLEALHHLQHAGLVASTVNVPGDTLMHRRYWRVPTAG